MKEIQQRYRIISLIGPPGSGKGTIGQKIDQEFEDIYHISVGGIAREAKKAGYLDKRMEDIMDRGDLFSPEDTVDIVYSHLNKNEYNKADIILLDGTPRAPEVASLFEKDFEMLGYICLDITKEASMKRLKKRFRETGRKDDANIEAIKNRWNNFENKTQPMLECLGKDKVYRINAERSVEDVYSSTREALINILNSSKGEVI